METWGNLHYQEWKIWGQSEELIIVIKNKVGTLIEILIIDVEMWGQGRLEFKKFTIKSDPTR